MNESEKKLETREERRRAIIENLDHIFSDCQRIKDKAIKIDGKLRKQHQKDPVYKGVEYFSLRLLVADLNRHWSEVEKIQKMDDEP